MGQGAPVATLLDPVQHDYARMRRGHEGADGAVVAWVKGRLPGDTVLALPAQNAYSDRFLSLNLPRFSLGDSVASVQH